MIDLLIFIIETFTPRWNLYEFRNMSTWRCRNNFRKPFKFIYRSFPKNSSINFSRISTKCSSWKFLRVSSKKFPEISLVIPLGFNKCILFQMYLQGFVFQKFVLEFLLKFLQKHLQRCLQNYRNFLRNFSKGSNSSEILLEILPMILPIITREIPSGIPPEILTRFFLEICPAVLSEIFPVIPSEIFSGILSKISPGFFFRSFPVNFSKNTERIPERIS